MSVLGRGDLAPSRTRQRRLTGLLLALLAVVLLAGIAGGGYYLLRSDGMTPAAPCLPRTTSARPAKPPTPATVHLAVLNGTGRTGLAKETGSLLRARGFAVDAVGNTSGSVTGPPVVRYGGGGRPAAELVALQLPSATLVSDPRLRGRLELVLGSAYTRLRTPAEVATAIRARNAARASVSPRPTATCR